MSFILSSQQERPGSQLVALLLFTIHGAGWCFPFRWLWVALRYFGEEGPGVHHDEVVEKFYTSTAWRKARGAVLAEHGGLCQICLSKGLIEPAVHVHHRIHLTADNINDPHITLDSSNLMALCEACHAEQHRTKRWRCDELGHVIL